MDAPDPPRRFDHEAWSAAAGTVLAYGLVLVVMTLFLFGVPFVLFRLL